MNYGCLFTSLNINILCFADDIAQIAPSAYGLQQLIDHLWCLLTESGFKINKDKCAFNVSKETKSFTVISKIYLQGSEVKRVTEVTKVFSLFFLLTSS